MWPWVIMNSSIYLVLWQVYSWTRVLLQPYSWHGMGRPVWSLEGTIGGMERQCWHACICGNRTLLLGWGVAYRSLDISLWLGGELACTLYIWLIWSMFKDLRENKLWRLVTLSPLTIAKGPKLLKESFGHHASTRASLCGDRSNPLLYSWHLVLTYLLVECKPLAWALDRRVHGLNIKKGAHSFKVPRAHWGVHTP